MKSRTVWKVASITIVAVMASYRISSLPVANAGSPVFPQGLNIDIGGLAGLPTGEISIQGVIESPPGSVNHGFETVFSSSVIGGLASLGSSSLNTLESVSKQWTSAVGARQLEISSPEVFGIVTDLTPSGIYVSQVSLGLTPAMVVSGVAGTLHATARFGAEQPVQDVTSHTSGLTADGALVQGSLPPPGNSFCGGYASACWISTGTVFDYPSSGRGRIPLAWIQDLGGAWGLISYSISSSASTTFNMGYAAGTGPDISGATFSSGGNDWASSVNFGYTYSIPPPGSLSLGYIYLVAQAEADQWQLYQCGAYSRVGTCIYYEKTNNYLWDAGLVNPATGTEDPACPAGNPSNALCGDQASGQPPFWSTLSGSSDWSQKAYESETGTGDSSPYYHVYGYQLADKYAGGTSWVTVGATIGIAILGDLTGVGLGLDIAQAIAGAVNIGTAEAWVQFDGPAGHSITLDSWVGSTSYYMSGGYGYIPLMGITIS